MRKGQSSLEYLLMIAVALILVLFVVRVLYGITNSPPDVKCDNVVISYVKYDAEGDDRNNLNDEYVVIENRGCEAVNLEGWQLKDESNHVYSFPSITLAPGASVRVHTGSGNDTDSDLYWGKGAPVWNNRGDTAYLYDADGKLVDSCSWTGTEGGAVSCH